MDIKIQDLHHTYPSGVHALQGITCEIPAGDLVAVVGQNGSGKTTLVKHLNGLLKPDRGEVFIGTWSTEKQSVARLATRVGYVFQNPDEQLFTKSVQQEISFGPRNLGYPEEKVQELVEQALCITDLTDARETNPYDLSPTWRKMVALASIIAMDTPIVIFDEPTTGQDAASIGRIGEVVELLRGQGKTLLTISHDIDFCADHFQRVIAMAEGKILLDGPAGQILGEVEQLATTYVDPPQITRLGLELGLEHTVLSEGELLKEIREMI